MARSDMIECRERTCQNPRACTIMGRCAILDRPTSLPKPDTVVNEIRARLNGVDCWNVLQLQTDVRALLRIIDEK